MKKIIQLGSNEFPISEFIKKLQEIKEKYSSKSEPIVGVYEDCFDGTRSYEFVVQYEK